jgi:carboxymethylenebutenolidase
MHIKQWFIVAVMLAAGCNRSQTPAVVPAAVWNHAARTEAIHFDTVGLRSGGDTLSALLARPAKSGRFPAVVILHANRLTEPYIATTAKMLAQAGFVAFAIDIFHFLPGNATWEQSRQVPGDAVGKAMNAEFREPRMLRDIESGVTYLRSQSYVADGGMGIIGFCGGGWNALLVAAQNRDIGAVVAYYAPLDQSDSLHRAPIELASYVRVPVQYHFALRDQYVSSAEVDSFAVLMKNIGTHFERFNYDAEHGFFAHNRTAVFNEAAAAQSWERTITFLRQHTGLPIADRPLAPARAAGSTQPPRRMHHALH